MIKDQIKVHARQSFEVKLDFPAKDFLTGNADFGMDMFLFLPPALDVNRHNFTKQDFYKSLKSYIRLSSPSLDMKMVLDKQSQLNVGLDGFISDAASLKTDRSEHVLTRKIKRYVSSINRSLGDEVKHLLRLKDMEKKQNETGEFIQNCYEIRNLFRDFLQKICVAGLSENSIKAARLADEYQSLMLEGHLYVLINGLTHKLDPSSKTMQDLHHLVLDEIRYRKKVDYPSVASNSRSNEHLLHRRGRLKRYIESNLFLNTDTRKEGVFYEQLFFSLAAGLAMVFATAIAFASQYAFGNLTMPFFIVLVISYMFKDRIKELSRMYFDKQRKKMFFDFRTAISLQKQLQIGYMRESFRFEKRKYLPPQVRAARERMRVTEISEEWIGDKVIHYKTQINMSARKTRKVEDFEGLTQIFRINITPFTTKMDDHEKEVFIKSKSQLKRQLINRVYHLNLIFRFTSGKDVKYKYYKLITDKLGVKRIDRIAVDEIILK
jgi:hypothetical protein